MVLDGSVALKYSIRRACTNHAPQNPVYGRPRPAQRQPYPLSGVLSGASDALSDASSCSVLPDFLSLAMYFEQFQHVAILVGHHYGIPPAWPGDLVTPKCTGIQRCTIPSKSHLRHILDAIGIQRYHVWCRAIIRLCRRNPHIF